MLGISHTRPDESVLSALQRRPGETLRACLERTLREAIVEGSLRAGVQLPASRRLAADLGVSRGVTSDTYAQLEAEGYLTIAPRRPPVVAGTSRPRSRRTIRARRAGPSLRFDMSPTTPDVTLFPRQQWSAALSAAIREADASALAYGDPQGSPVLRERLADELGRTRGVICEPSNIIVLQGAVQGIDLVLRALRERGAQRIAVEDPSLVRQQAQINAHGLELVGQPMDRDGLIVSGLDADAVIVSPTHQFPTGAVMSSARRRELVEWSHATGKLVIEDDHDAGFRYDREPMRTLQGLHPDGVIHMGSTSTTLAPALRLGWLIAPDRLVETLATCKLLIDEFSPPIEQLAFARMLERGHYQRHVRKTRSIYHARRDRLVAALSEHLPELSVSGAAAGLSVTLSLPPGADDREVERAACYGGIRLEALSRHSVCDRSRRGLVLGYGRVHESAIRPAIATLSRIICSVAR